MTKKKQYYDFGTMYSDYNNGAKYDPNTLTSLERPEGMGETDWAVYQNLYNAEKQNQALTNEQNQMLANKKAERTNAEAKIMDRQQAREYYMGDTLKAQGLNGSLRANVLTDAGYNNAYRNALTSAASEYDRAENDIIAKYTELMRDNNTKAMSANADLYSKLAANTTDASYGRFQNMLSNGSIPIEKAQEYYNQNSGNWDDYLKQEAQMDMQEIAASPERIGSSVKNTYNTTQTLPDGSSLVVYDGNGARREGRKIYSSSGDWYDIKRDGTEYTGPLVSTLTAIFAKAPEVGMGQGRKVIEYNGELYVQTDDGRIWSPKNTGSER